MAWPLASLPQAAILSVLGESITYTNSVAGATAQVLTGIFDAEHTELSLTEIDGVVTVSPKVTVKLADLEGGVALKGGTVAARGVTYEVASVHPDGQGMVTMRLYEAPPP